MGQRGPRKTPAEVKKARGTYRADRDAEVDFSPPAGKPAEPPPKPEGLHDLASAEWDRLTPIMLEKGLLTAADWIAWQLGFAAYDTWLVASDQLRIDADEAEKRGEKGRGSGMIVWTEKGYPVQHPLVAIAGKAWATVLKFCREFGLTPSARSGLNLDSGPSGNADPLSELLKRRSNN